MKSSFLILLLINILAATGQNTLRHKGTDKLPPTSREVISSFVDESNGQYIRVYWSNVVNKTIEKGAFAGYGTIEADEGLIFEDGSEFKIEDGHIGFNKQKNFVAESIEHGPDVTHIKSYRIEGNSVLLLGDRTVNSIEHGVEVLKNGMLLLSDESEGAGTYIEIATPALKTLNTYRSNFAFSRSTSSTDHIFVVLSYDDAPSKFLRFNAVTGKLELERNLETRESPMILSYADGAVVSYSTDGTDYLLKAYTGEGGLLWRKQYLIPRPELFQYNGDIYFSTNDDLVNVDALSGQQRWKKSLSEISNAKDQLRRLVSVRFDDNYIYFISADDGVPDQHVYETEKRNLVLTRMKSTGEVLSVIPLKSTARHAVLRRSGNAISVILDDEVLNYEIK